MRVHADIRSLELWSRLMTDARVSIYQEVTYFFMMRAVSSIVADGAALDPDVLCGQLVPKSEELVTKGCWGYVFEKWWAREDSNFRPLPCQGKIINHLQTCF